MKAERIADAAMVDNNTSAKPERTIDPACIQSSVPFD